MKSKLALTSEPRTTRIGLPAAVRGLLTGFNENGEGLIDFWNNPLGHPIAAVATIALGVDDVGSEAVLVFEEGDPGRPIIMGLIKAPGRDNTPPGVEVPTGRKTLYLVADEEVVLRCGQASITLTRAGKVLIRGSYLLSRSSGINRIKGGSVQLN